MKKIIVVSLIVFCLLLSNIALAEEVAEESSCQGFWGKVSCVLFGDPVKKDQAKALAGQAGRMGRGSEEVPDIKEIVLEEKPVIKCRDSDDGRNFEVKGKIKGADPKNPDQEMTEEDRCSDDTRIIEFECKDDSLITWNGYDCPNNGVCRDGACVKREVEILPANDEVKEMLPATNDEESVREVEEVVVEEKKVICRDTDGGYNVDKKGTITGLNVDGNEVTYTDFCRTSQSEARLDSCTGTRCRIKEWACSNNIVGSNVLSCKYGCEDGACLPLSRTTGSAVEEPVVEEDTTPEVEETAECTDSDRGQNIYLKGETFKPGEGTLKNTKGLYFTDTVRGRTWEDACQLKTETGYSSIDSNRCHAGDDCYIIEFSCNADSVRKPCPNGCADGACLKTAQKAVVEEVDEEVERKMEVEVKETRCADGLDNDNDNNIDCFDADCGPAAGEIYQAGDDCTLTENAPTCCLYHSRKAGTYVASFDTESMCLGAGRFPVINERVCERMLEQKGYVYIQDEKLEEEVAEEVVEEEIVKECDISSTLLEGETDRFVVSGVDYEISVTNFLYQRYAGGVHSVDFSVNGERFTLLEGERYLLADDSYIVLNDMLYQDYAGGVHSATFCLMVEVSDLPPGLEELPPGLAEKDKTPPGWKKGEKRGWEEVTEVTEEEAEVYTVECNGCESNGKCLPFGTRKIVDEVDSYCDLEGRWAGQSSLSASCQNDYECQTNECSNGKCEDLAKKLEETENTLNKLLDFVKKFFGVEEDTFVIEEDFGVIEYQESDFDKNGKLDILNNPGVGYEGYYTPEIFVLVQDHEKDINEKVFIGALLDELDNIQFEDENEFDQHFYCGESQSDDFFCTWISDDIFVALIVKDFEGEDSLEGVQDSFEEMAQAYLEKFPSTITMNIEDITEALKEEEEVFSESETPEVEVECSSCDINLAKDEVISDDAETFCLKEERKLKNYLTGGSDTNYISGLIVTSNSADVKYMENDDDVLDNYLLFSSGEEIGEFVIQFVDFKSNVEGTTLVDFIGVEFNILGKTYKIIEAEIPSGEGSLALTLRSNDEVMILMDDNIEPSNEKSDYNLVIDDEEIDGVEVSLGGGFNNDGDLITEGGLTFIAIKMIAEDNYFVPVGGKLSDAISEQGEDPRTLFTQTWDWKLASYNPDTGGKMFTIGSCDVEEEAVENEEELSEVKGVSITIDQNNPPASISDLKNLVALVNVENEGGHEIGSDDCFVSITGFDQNILTSGFGDAQTCTGELDSLSTGDKTELRFEGDINLPPGVDDYDPQLNFNVCYGYHTYANPSVCVDPLFYQVSTEPKECVPEDINIQSDEVAPIDVVNVEVNMVSDGKAVFEIELENFGDGKILSSEIDLQSCTQNLDYDDLYKVGYNVQLSGGELDHCLPNNFVKLINNKGTIVCTFNVNGDAAFETNLDIDLDYKYLDSKIKPLEILDE